MDYTVAENRSTNKANQIVKDFVGFFNTTDAGYQKDVDGSTVWNSDDNLTRYVDPTTGQELAITPWMDPAIVAKGSASIQNMWRDQYGDEVVDDLLGGVSQSNINPAASTFNNTPAAPSPAASFYNDYSPEPAAPLLSPIVSNQPPDPGTEYGGGSTYDLEGAAADVSGHITGWLTANLPNAGGTPNAENTTASPEDSEEKPGLPWLWIGAGGVVLIGAFVYFKRG